MKVLILTTALGGGHNSAARAIARGFDSLGVENTVLDFYEYIDPLLKEAASTGYLFSINSLSLIRGFASDLYDFNEKRKDVGDFSISKLQTLVLASELKKFIFSYQPDVIICTQVYAAQVISLLKEKGVTNALSIGIVTDFTVQIYWTDTQGLDYIVVPSDRLSYQLAQRGISRERILPIGIPIDPKFQNRTAQQEARRLLKLNPDKKTLLVMGGSMGFGGLDKYVSAMDRCALPFQILVVCGNNTKLLQKLKKMDFEHPIECYGFTDQVPLMMDASDAVVTKPGGITTSEALGKGLPLILISPIPGMEERNAEFLVNSGVALYVSKTFPIDEAISLMFSFPDRLRHLRECVGMLSHPCAAEELCRFCISKTVGLPASQSGEEPPKPIQI